MAKVNDIVQITDESNQHWFACLVQVSEVKSWGIQGFIKIPMQGDAYIRLKTGSFEVVGTAVLSPEH